MLLLNNVMRRVFSVRLKFTPYDYSGGKNMISCFNLYNNNNKQAGKELFIAATRFCCYSAMSNVIMNV